MTVAAVVVLAMFDVKVSLIGDASLPVRDVSCEKSWMESTFAVLVIRGGVKKSGRVDASEFQRVGYTRRII